MARRIAISVLAPLLPLLLLLLAAVAAPLAVRAGDPCFHDLTRPAVTDAAVTAVTVADDCAFSPTIARVPVGATVTFTNTSFQAHEVAGANLTWGAAQKPVPPGGSLTQTFEAAGIYPYSCMIHPGMTGVIVVGDGAAATSDGTTTTGGATTTDGAVADGGLVTVAAAASDDSVVEAWLAAGVPILAVGLAVILVVAAWLLGRRRARRAPSI